MSKRKVTHQQQQRIQAQQTKRRERVHALQTPEQHGLVIAHYGKFVDVETSAKKIIHCKLRQHLPILVPGDHIIWQQADDGTGVVSAIEPRRSQLARKDQHDQLRPIAANVDIVVITVAPLPEMQELFIDRYLVALENLHLMPIIICNKIDLLATSQHHDLQQRLNIYAKLGYAIYYASATTQQGLTELASALTHKTSVFVGQSGVGKSSLIEQLIPGVNLHANEISAQTTLGKHTTSTSRLYHLPCGGQVIDSPGTRNFDLWSMALAEVSHGFREFREYAGHCKFRDCKHLSEPGCAIQQALAAGKINPLRLANFHAIIAP